MTKCSRALTLVSSWQAATAVRSKRVEEAWGMKEGEEEEIFAKIQICESLKEAVNLPDLA